MKITFDSAAMSRQFAAASRVLNNRNSFPILDCYLFEVAEDGSHVAITASDNENTLRIVCPLVAFESDADAAKRRFCVKARLVMDALKEIPAQPVTLAVNMQSMEIRGGYANGHFAIVGDRADEYPVPPVMDGSIDNLTMPASRLRSEIDGTKFALADDEIRPVMTGVFFDLTPETMTCVGTDGRTLVRRCTKSDDVTLPQRAVSFILPKKTAGILNGLLSSVGEVNMAFTDKQLHVRAESFELYARFIDGHYPNYNSVIPKGSPYTADVNTSDLIPAVRRVMTFADRESALVRLTLSADALKLKCKDTAFAVAGEETIPATFDGPTNFAIGAKGSILLDVLTHLPKDINIKLGAPDRAMIFTPAEQDPDTAVLMLVMPMMLND